jgi:hypothetical protein
MKLMPIVAVLTSLSVVGVGSAFAQAPAPAPAMTPATPAPAMAPAAGAMAPAATMTKAQISKACSTQADAKKLHGKPRNSYRSACIKNGGKGA